MSAPLVVAGPGATPLVSGLDLMVVALLAFACFGLPGIAAMLYFQHRTDD